MKHEHVSAKATNSIRKAAVLIASLDKKTAEMLLGGLDGLEAELLRQSVAELGPLSPEEQTDVIEEFFRIGPLVPAEDPAGIELDGSLAVYARAADRAADQNSPAARPFQFLDDARCENLVEVLTEEQPQTVAVVLSHLDATQASGVLARLPGDQQARVLRRLVDLDDASPEVVRAVEQGLVSQILHGAQTRRRQRAGLNTVARILESDDGIGRTILRNLESHDPQLAAQLGREPIEFGDVPGLDDAALIEVLAAADRDVITLALAGADVAAAKRLLSLLPPDEAAGLRQRLANLGPTTLNDLEEAKQRIAQLVTHLVAQGRIDPPQSTAVA